MEEEIGGAEQYVLPVSVGDRLRGAREEKGLTLEQVAAETKITERHLSQIEAGDFVGLPARTYAIGFSRSYARLLGLDEHEIAREVRAELSAREGEGAARPRTFEPGDPARVPSPRLAWIAALAGLAIFLVGSLFLWRGFIAPAGELPWLTSEQPPAAPQAASADAPVQAAPARVVSGPVVFTSLEDGIWVKFYDRGGNQLMQKQMAAGESYTVPADADGPQIWTGRPDALTIEIGGKAVPKLAETHRIMKDVPVSADALLTRGDTAEAASPTA